MLAITCSSCQKKLSVKDDLAGKKVKCPSCGQVTTVAAKPAVVGTEEMRTVPPSVNLDGPTIPPKPADASDTPTSPSLSKPDATQGIKPDAGHDASLTDFLAPPQADDELGRLGEFRILKILGHGGMGVVFLGEDATLRRKVAIKAMLPHLAESKSSQQRFLREARSAATLEHDHIVAIHHVGVDRGAPYIVMPFLKGEPLDERLKRDEPIPLAEMLRIGREIAEALNAAHGMGLVHRDIKPANVWLEAPKHRVKILDFGLARAVQEDSGLTQQGAIIGTPAYMAPEQGRGDPVDARCDLFSLGVVLYRLCTGQQPFHGKDTVSTLMSVAMTEPAAPIKINGELPQELSDLVMKLLEKDPANRTGSAAEVVQAIQAIETKLAHEKMETGKTETLNAGDPKHGITTNRRASAATASPQTSDATTKTIAPPPRRKSLALIAIGLVVVFGAFCLLASGGIYYWQTNNGIVRIEINDPDIKVAFDKNGPIITGVDQKDIKLTPGEFGLTVQRGDLKFDTDKFILKRGETITLKIEWFKEGKLQVVQAGKGVIGEKVVPKVDVAVGSHGDYALDFDGDKNNVKLPNLPLDCSKPYTLEAFVIAKQGQDEKTFILYSSVQTALGVRPTAGKIFFDLSHITGYTQAQSEFPLNRRLHVAAVRTPKKLTIFVDGKLAASKEVSDPTVKAPDLWRIGGAFKNSFKGIIDEVRISKSARYDKDFTPAKRFEPDADTLALYHFDEGSGDVLKDSSGNGHHGKIIGAKWVKADGTRISRPGSDSLDFDGKSAVRIPSLKLPSSGPFTLECYSSQAEFKTEAQFMGIVTQGMLRVFNGGEWEFYAQQKDSQFRLRFHTARHNRRMHAAVVRSGDDIHLFLDGKLVQSKKLEDRLLQKDVGAEFLLGNGLIGTLGEARVSKTARYTKDFAPAQRFEPDADTLALYHFDEGSGDVLKDSSGNNHHGKIAGAKWVKADGTAIAPPPADGWVPLFNGTDLTGWAPEAGKPNNWKVVDGAITGTGPESYLYSVKEDYDDFHLRVEAKVNAGGNSGVFFGAANPRTNGWGYEAQIDSTVDKQKTGSLYGLVAVEQQLVGPDQWFVMEIIARGPKIEIFVDGKKVVDYTETKKKRQAGAFALQHSSPETKVFFRKIELKQSTPSAFDAWLKQVAALPVQQQAKAVGDKLMQHNLGFDGRVKEKIDGNVVTELEFVTDNVTDLAPLRALPGLKTLKCGGTHSLLKAKGKLEDLTPLKDMKLTALYFPYTKVSDLTPLKDLPLTELNCHHTKVSDLRPLEHMKLTILDCGGLGTPVADFSPLRGMPLVALRCNLNPERDSAILRSIPTLQTINGKDAKELLKETAKK